jgi:hypothetical protein
MRPLYPSRSRKNDLWARLMTDVLGYSQFEALSPPPEWQDKIARGALYVQGAKAARLPIKTS